MQTFAYVRPQRVDDAIEALRQPRSRCIAGGTNLVDLMKGGVEQPNLLIDITRLPLADVSPTAEGGVYIGALVRNSDLAGNPIVREHYPLLSQALLAGASPQLRNMATTGGNLLQRTRCYYFTDAAFPACNKRAPGSGCGAREGRNRIHAIFGASPQCVATHPSDMCVAMAAQDATVEVQGSGGRRQIPFADFHRLPGDTPERDTNLLPGELIVGVVLPRSPYGNHVHYLKVRDRASYAFALVSVAAALQVSDGHITDSRIVLGGVAHKPWRALAAEQVLQGRPLDAKAAMDAGNAAADGAQPLRDNAFKVDLTRRAVARAVRTAGDIT